MSLIDKCIFLRESHFLIVVKKFCMVVKKVIRP